MAKYEWLDDYLQALPGTVKQYQEEWQAWKYMLADKMFAMVGGDKEEKPIVTLKLEPARGKFLRGQYPGTVIPGYYMNKVHWNSLYLDGDVPDDVLRDMVTESHRLILTSLSKKLQREIGEATA